MGKARVAGILDRLSCQNFWSKSLCLRYTEEPSGSIVGWKLLGLKLVGFDCGQFEKIESKVLVLLAPAVKISADTESLMSMCAVNGEAKLFSPIFGGQTLFLQGEV